MEGSVEVQTREFSTTPAPALWVIKLSFLLIQWRGPRFQKTVDSHVLSLVTSIHRLLLLS